MTQREIAILAQKYITAANELDKAGFTKEAAEIDEEIFFAIEAGILPIKLKTVKIASLNTKNTRVAIIGQSDWNDYLENMATGAGGAAGMSLGSGVAAGAAPIAALWGAGLGAAGTLGRDVMFNHLQGQTSQLESLNKGLEQSISALTKTVGSYDPGSAQQILQLYDGINEKVKAMREQKRREISEEVGLDPEKGFLQSIDPRNWGKVLNRSWKMITSDNDNSMTKEATSLDDTTGVMDPTFSGAGLGRATSSVAREQARLLAEQQAKQIAELQAQGYTKQQAQRLVIPKKGLAGALSLGGMAGGMIGGAVGRGGYNWIANKMRGQAGILKKQISDIQKYGVALAKASQDPSIVAITNGIASLAQRTLQAILAGQPPLQQSQDGMAQPAPPAQYWKSDQSFR